MYGVVSMNAIEKILRRKLFEQDKKIMLLQNENERLKSLMSPRQNRIVQNRYLSIDQHPSRGLVHAIVDHVSSQFSINKVRIERPGKDHKISRASQTCWYLMKLNDDDIQLTEMGRFFGRNWSTVATALRRVNAMMTRHHSGLDMSKDEMKQIQIIQSFGVDNDH